MPEFTLRWANRSNSTQDWQVNMNHDAFTLQPNYTRNVRLNVNQNLTIQVAVSTEGRFAAASLTYTAATGVWTLNSNTPNEFQLATGNGIVTVRCLLENANAEAEAAN